MKEPTGNFNVMRWAGLFFIIIGGGWAGKSLIKKS